MNKTKFTSYFKSKLPSTSERDVQFLYEDLILEGWSSSEIWDKRSWFLQKIVEATPIQYISGIAHFYGLVFKVNSDVLIPRAETEELVYLVEKEVKSRRGKTCILDIGTGSGCIPISIKYKCPNSKVEALDISERALTLAEENATRNQVEVSFSALDFLNTAHWSSLGQYDIIVSNPPYIPYSEQNLMSSGVLDYEPHLALFVSNEDPLIFYRLIAIFANSNLNASGKLYLELNENNGNSVESLYEEMGYKNVKIVKDLQGKDRILVVSK